MLLQNTTHLQIYLIFILILQLGCFYLNDSSNLQSFTVKNGLIANFLFLNIAFMLGVIAASGHIFLMVERIARACLSVSPLVVTIVKISHSENGFENFFS